MSRRRFALVVCLVVLATLITLVGSLTIWTKRQLLDNGSWRTSSAKILQRPEVRTLLATDLVNAIYMNTDVEQRLSQNLPAGTQKLAPVIASALQTASVRAAETFLASPRGQQLWVNVSSRAHDRVVDVLEGKKVRNIDSANGQIVLDLRPVIEQLSTRLGLGANLTSRLPPTAGQIVLVKSADLKNAQRAVRLLKALTVVTVLLALILYGVAVYLARGSRLRVLASCGLAVSVVGLLLLILRRFVGTWVTGSLVKTDANRPAVHQIWLVETELMRDLAIALIVYGIFAMVAAWLGGGARYAVRLRHWLAPTFRAHAIGVYAAAALLFLVYLAWGPSAGGRRIGGEIVLAVLFFAGLAFWRRQMLSETAAVPAPR